MAIVPMERQQETTLLRMETTMPAGAKAATASLKEEVHRRSFALR
jgi:hypothetical protein